MTNSNRSTRNRVWAIPVFLVLLLAAGCGPMGSSRIDVPGKIAIAGKPLNQGTMIFQDEQGQAVSVNINPDGTFVIPEVKPGPFQFAIEVPPPVKQVARRDADPARGARPSAIQVPKRYSKIETSGLNLEIEAGKPLEIDLKP